jgi:hypothetical protein
MQSLFRKNYQKHPAFIFDEDEWLIDTNDLIRFADLYILAKQKGHTLDKKILKFIQGESSFIVEKIFSTMKSQATDKHEKYFLDELKSKCIKLLDDEFSWYGRILSIDKIKLGNPYQNKNLSKLKNDYFFVGHLSDKVISKIKYLSENQINIFKKNQLLGKLKRTDLSVNRGALIRKIIKILNKEFSRLGVLDVISAYTGSRMHVSGCALELSVPDATWWKNSIPLVGKGPKTMYAHLDEGIGFPKAIAYLSDVNQDSGPTSCYPGVYKSLQLNPLQELIGRIIGEVGSSKSSNLFKFYRKSYHQSMNSENFRRHFMRLPAQLRFNSHMGWDIIPKSILEKKMTSSEMVLNDKAGTFIAFDGARLFHRGGLVKKNNRLALQIIFSENKPLLLRIIKKIKRIFYEFKSIYWKINSKAN